MELNLTQSIILNVAVHYSNYKGSADLNHTLNDLLLYPTMTYNIYEDEACTVLLQTGTMYFSYYDSEDKIAYYYIRLSTGDDGNNSPE